MKKLVQKNDFILIGVLAGIVAILDVLGVISFPIGVFGVSAFYFGAAFFSAFAVWFGRRGIISIYIGLFIAALFTGFHIFVPLGALGNTLGAVVVFLTFKYIKLNPSLKTFKDYIGYIGSVSLGSNIVGALWTITILNFAGIIPTEAIKPAMSGWIIGGIIVSLIIGIPLFKLLTPVVKKLSIANK